MIENEQLARKPKTRWKLMFWIFMLVIGLPLIVIFALFALQTPPVEEKPQVTETQPVPVEAKAVRYFDYTKIVSTIGLAFKERQTTESGEVWMNSSATSVTLIGAPNAITKVSVMMQGNGDDEEQKFNAYLLNDLSTILVGDSNAVLGFINQVKMDTKETRIINGVSVLVAKVSLNQLKNSAIFYTFTFPD